MSQITTHVLDTASGKPADGIPVQLFQQSEQDSALLAEATTDSDGRITDLLAEDVVLDAGCYRLVFSLEDYFKKTQQQIFYPCAEVVFIIPDESQHYHLPLLLSPYSYSTYRGS